MSSESESRTADEEAESAEAGERAPVFVVGSPRSGTSILTWSLSQHPNLLHVEETSWLAKLAVNLIASHQLGSARGMRSQLSAASVTRQAFMAAFGDTAFDVVREHGVARARRTVGAKRESEFRLIRSSDDPKRRWVDGTPEYSHHIVGLRELFPRAKFIHILRDVDPTVLSMVNFHKLGGDRPRWDWEQAYGKWIAHVESCVAAERALGSSIVIRVHNEDLRSDPEATIRTCLEFLDEPFAAACLEPLQQRINSSHVSDRQAAPKGRKIDPELERRAQNLSSSLKAEAPRRRPFDAELVAELDAEYRAKLPQLERMYANWAATAEQRRSKQPASQDDSVEAQGVQIG